MFGQVPMPENRGICLAVAEKWYVVVRWVLGGSPVHPFWDFHLKLRLGNLLAGKKVGPKNAKKVGETPNLTLTPLT